MPADPANLSPPPRPRVGLPWHLFKPVLAMALLVAAVLGAIGGALAWLLGTEDGTRWIVARLPWVEARGVRGTIASGHLAADQVVVRWSDGKAFVAVDGFDAEGLRFSLRPSPRAWFGVAAERAHARRVAVDTGPPGPRPIVLPASIGSPVAVDVRHVSADELVIESLPPFRKVSGRVVIAAADGSGYVAENVAFDWDRFHGEGRYRMADEGAFEIASEARFSAPGESGRLAAWTAQARASGPMSRFDLVATLGGLAMPGAPAQSLDLRARIVPFEPWAIARLEAQATALDLSALLSRAPQTRLTGSVQLQTRALDAPIGADVQLDNALPGRLDQQRLPLRRVEAQVRALPAQRDRIEFHKLDLLLGSAAEPAGRWQGSGHWQGDTLQLDTRLDEVLPQRVDPRAAAMTLTGPLAFKLRGLPSPDPAAAPPARPLGIEASGTLDGRLAQAPLPVQLAFELDADARRLELRQLRARAGSALAVLAGKAQRGSDEQWRIESHGSLTDFDPLPWWPGDEGSAWRQGPHRLSATWVLDLRLPADAAQLAPLALAPRLAGNGRLRVADSVLAGVPVALELTLGQRPGAAPASLDGEAQIAGSQWHVQGQGDPLGEGRDDRLRVELRADDLARLAPLVQLVPAWREFTPRSGRVQGELTFEGRWPQVRTSGRAETQGLRIGEASATQLRAAWRLDSSSDQPLALQLDVESLAVGRQRLERLHAELRGTLAEHRLELDAALPITPPAGLQRLLALRSGSGTQLRLAGQGAWKPATGGGGRWSGQVSDLAAGPWRPGAAAEPRAPAAASAAAAAASAGWVAARNLRAELDFDAQGRLARLQADPGRIRFADGVTLRWDEVKADFSTAAPSLQLHADIEPFAAAPLLARMQPGLGWEGDLRLAARLDLNLGQQVDADVVFERRDGDLVLADEFTRQAFGLSDLRIALAAHQGTWYLTSAFAGKSIGEMAGALRLNVPTGQRWPDAQTPIDGVVEARVANLGIWGTWVPPGWRLSGTLQTSASVGGRIGAPDYAGRIVGSGIGVRNLLQGVDVSQGEVAIRLQGANAEIETFTLRGGEGRITVSGRADLGGSPQARLALAAERFRVLGRVDRQLTASGQATLALGAERLQLDGSVKVDEALFDIGSADAPTLDGDVSVRRPARAAEEPEPEPAPRARRDTQVTVDLDLGDKLRVRGRGLESALRGQLRLGSSAGRLTVRGTVSADGGTYRAYGQNLDIERGLLLFGGEPDNPGLDVLALRPNLDVQVGVAISGSLQSPRVRLYSNADMSDSDKLSWLVLGRAPDGLGRADTALLQRAAVALLAGEGEAPTDALLRNLGIDQLSLRQGEGDVRETVVSLGKQLSRRWYLGYERGVNATTGTWQLIYRIAQRFTLRAQSGQENSLDVIWVWRLEEPKAGTPPRPAASAPP